MNIHRVRLEPDDLKDAAAPRQSRREGPMPFKFPLSWNWVCGQAEHTAPARETHPNHNGLNSFAAPARWEMVVPRLDRSGRTRLGRNSTKEVVVSKQLAAPGVDTAPALELSQAQGMAAPIFELAGASRSSAGWFRRSIPAQVVLLGGVITAGVFLLTGNSTRSASPAEVGMLMNSSREWDVAWSVDPEGLRQNRQLRVLRAFVQGANSSFQFLWHPAQPVGCIVHYGDPGNYSGLRLQLMFRRNSRAIAVERFLVWNGKYQTSGRTLTPLRAADAAALPVRLEIAGPAVTAKIAGQTIDHWVVPRFRVGAAGFFADGEARAQVEQVRIAPLPEPGPAENGAF